MRKGLGAATLAAALSISLVAASSGPSSPRGTAETRLFAVELDIDPGSGLDLGQLPGSLDVLDAGTYASTDTDEARNALGKGAAYAEAAAVPLRIGTTEIGAVRASTSSGTQRSTSTGGSIGSLTGVIGAQVDPIVATASAAEDEASAVLGNLSAQLGALASVLDLDVDAEDVASLVDATHSASGVKLDVSGVSLTLGDLIPADVLAQLPLSTILDLLETLPISLDTDVAGAIDALQDTVADVQDQVATIAAAEQAVADAAAAHLGLEDEVAALQALADDAAAIVAAIAALGTTPTVDTTLVDTVNALLTDTHNLISATSGQGISATDCQGLPTSVTPDDLLASLDVLDQIEACAAALQTALEAAITAAIQAAVDALQPVIDDLTAAVAELETLLGAVTAAAEALLSFVQDLLAGLTDAAGVELLGVDGFSVGLSAVATGTTATSQAVVGCTAVTARVLGEASQTPSCAGGLSQVTAVAGQVEAAIAQVEAVLAVLPVSDVAAIGDLRLELFGALTESVVEDGDYVVSTAGIELLELEVPSLTIDPAGVTSWLGDLDLGNVLVDVAIELDEAMRSVQTVFGSLPAGDTPLAQLQASYGSVVGDGELSGVVEDAYFATLGALDALLAALPEPLDVEFATPGFTLVIDPVATAEFASVATAGAPDPSGSGDPTSGAPLPATGGGLALMGLVGIGGALALRKRR